MYHYIGDPDVHAPSFFYIHHTLRQTYQLIYQSRVAVRHVRHLRSFLTFDRPTTQIEGQWRCRARPDAPVEEAADVRDTYSLSLYLSIRNFRSFSDATVHVSD